MIDSHAHYNGIDIRGLLNQMDMIENDDRIEAVINTATCGDTSKEILKWSTEYSKFYTTIGCSNGFSSSFSLTELERLYNEDSKIVGIGEIGLTDTASLIYEMSVFKKQIELANALELPVIIDGNSELDFILKILANNKPKYGCMIENPIRNSKSLYENLKKIVASGYYVSLSGKITYYTDLNPAKKIIDTIPNQQLLVGSNAPFEVPSDRIDRRNSSLYLSDTIKYISEIKNMCYNDVEQLTSNNAKELFKRMK